MNMQTNNFRKVGGDYVNGDKYHIGLKPPDDGNPNGCDCPQCNSWTWQHTKYCVYCGFDIEHYFLELAQLQQQELEAARKAFKKQQTIYLWVFVAVCIFVFTMVFLLLDISLLNLAWVYVLSVFVFVEIQKFAYR